MTVRISTTAAAVWTAGADWASRPTRVGAFLGTEFLGEGAVTQPAALLNGDTYTVDSGQNYDFTFTPAGATAASVATSDRALAALMNAGAGTVVLSLALFTADPGNDGSTNEIQAATNSGYARKAVAYSVTQV